MSTAKIILVDSSKLGDFYFTTEPAMLARHLLSLGYYDTKATIDLLCEGEDACEEIFDLTNNPMRQGDREVRYGRGRSVSVGDIVEVDGVKYLCRPNGWIEVEMA